MLQTLVSNVASDTTLMLLTNACPVLTQQLWPTVYHAIHPATV